MPRGNPDWKSQAPQKDYIQLLREGNAFGASHSNTSIANKHVTSQLYNPSDSGVDLLIYRLTIATSNVSFGGIYFDQDQFVTFERNGQPRLSGGSQSKARLNYRWQDYESNIHIESWSTIQFERVIYQPAWFWVKPGWGINVEDGKPEQSLDVSYTWFEFTEY